MKTTRTFSLAHSREFAEVSGDMNPLHLDAMVARRSPFGRPVVHGVHLLLHALEFACRSRGRIRLTNVRSAFRHPVLIDQAVSFEFDEAAAGQKFSVQVWTDGSIPAARFDVEWSPDEVEEDAELSPCTDSPSEPRELNFEQALKKDGTIIAHCHVDGLRRLFPHATDCLPLHQLMVLTAISKLVGMECPGLQSLFSKLAVRFQDKPHEDGRLRYRIAKADERFQMLTIAVEGCGCVGELVAFVRPRPQRQLAFEKAVQLVRPGEFANRVALVVGGSRGLGEATAKLLAAGGADVWITFAQGADDAERVISELRESEGKVQSLHLDVLSLEDSSLLELRSKSRDIDVFYFATPTIIGGSAKAFSSQRFRQFCDFYVVGLARLLETLRRRGHRLSHLLCPSSEFVETTPNNMAEYAAAKAACESLGQFLARYVDGLAVHCPRWPRLATDQTVSTVPDEFSDTAQTVLNSIRDLYRSSAMSAS